MAELLLTQAVNQAEEAIETGNYGGAIETCQRILGEFPEFARAHRIMAEAHAEQGDAEAAREAFRRTLERDPQSIAAHVGLAMIAEEAGELEGALAHFQVAWEIDPRRRDLREHVSRLSQQVYGDDGRLYLTRAALASLHFHAGRWDRAVSEAAQVLQELSQRVDVQVRMAEALWRRGDDDQARQVGTTILRTLPSAVVPLLILADIQRRQGNEGAASDMLEQARAIDPDGVRAADLVMVGLDDQADFLSVEDVPTIEERVLTEEPATRYAPAPDFIGDDEEAGRAETDRAAGAAEGGEASPTAAEAAGQDQAPDPGLQPFRWEDIGDEDLEASDLGEAARQLEGDLSSLPGREAPAESFEETAAADDSISLDLFTDEELEQARPSDSDASGYTGVLQSLDEEGMQPFDPGGGFDEVVEESSGPESPEEVVEEFTLDPFQPEAPADATRPISPEPEAPSSEPVEPAEEMPASETDPFEVDWARVDEEIEDARPGDIPRGYTDELRDLDSIGVEPFSLGDEEEPAPHQADTEDLDDLMDTEPSAEPEQGAQPEEPVADAMDLDELARGWESSTEEFAQPDVSGGVEQPADEVPAEQERSEALESLEDLFGDYEAESFQETEPLRAADPESFELPDLGEPGAGEHQESASEPFAAAEAAREPEVSPVYESTPPEFETPEAGEREQPAAAMAEYAPSEATPGGGAPVTFEMSAERLGFGQELIDRARQGKQELVRRGVISGARQLPGAGVSVDSLRGAVQQDPLNIDRRIALASALVDESPDEALEQYRWLYRNAPKRAVELVDDLSRLIQAMSKREGGAHRLLAAVYRRHGDWRLAATHYEESLMLMRRHLK